MYNIISFVVTIAAPTLRRDFVSRCRRRAVTGDG